MKKQFRFLALLFLLVLALTGCSIAAEAEEERLEPLDAAAWPTPIPNAPAASPTPFPQVELAAVTATPRATIAPTSTSVAVITAGPTLVQATRRGETPGTAQSTATATAPQAARMTDLKPITTAQVKSDGLNRRQGPGATYAKLDTLAQNAQVSILAFNRTKDWVLVETPEGQQGWVSLAYLTVQGDVSQAPVVLSAPPAASTAQPNSATSISPAEPVSFQAISPVEPASSAQLTGLGTVAVARIAQNEVYVRPGPGTDYAGMDKLTDPQEQIPVLALDQSRKWVLVQPASAQTGWVVLNELAVQGSLVDAPQIFTAWVTSNAVEVRSGPGIFHDQTGQLAINSLVRVLGLDDNGSWALIQPIPGGSLSWAPIQFLTNVGRPWADVPHAPELPAPASVAATAEPFTPARPVSESKIVFQRSSGGDIMVINPDGTGLRRLTNGIDPVLSPDGQTVAFTRWQGETGTLWTIGVDGSNETAVAGEIKQAKGPDWSPDGTRIVLNFQHGGRLESTTRCYDLSEGAPPRPPRNATNSRVEIAGEDVDFCYTLPPDPQWGLRVIDLVDGSFEDVDGGRYVFRPTWDPAQPWRIVSDAGDGLVQVDLGTANNNRRLTDAVNDGSPVFSPDGRYLALTSGTPGGSSGYNIERMIADGRGRVQLTQTPLWVTVLPDGAKAWNNVSPAWSPDASQIAFLTDRTGRWEVWVMNADGSDPHPLFSDEVNAQLQITYNFVDERVLSWR